MIKLLFATISLYWAHNADQPWDNWKIHIGTQAGVYSDVIDAGAALEYTVEGLKEDQEYCFALEGYNAGGASSGPGKPICYVTKKKISVPVFSKIVEN